MSKKMMLLGLIVASMAMFALPAMASATTMEIDPGNNEFEGSAIGGSLSASGEPTITCEKTDVTGKFTSKTGGTLTLDFTGCHINVLGFTVKCRSANSPADNTIASGGAFDAITYNNKPAMLVTANPTTLSCASSNIEVTGSVIGTITAPACNVESNTATIAFTKTGNVQNHKLYTGKEYYLTANTDPSAEVEAAIETTVTITSVPKMKMTCQ